jgi:hypothetical protein
MLVSILKPDKWKRKSYVTERPKPDSTASNGPYIWMIAMTTSRTEGAGLCVRDRQCKGDMIRASNSPLGTDTYHIRALLESPELLASDQKDGPWLSRVFFLVWLKSSTETPLNIFYPCC